MQGMAMRTAGSWGWDGAVLPPNGATLGRKWGWGWLGCAAAGSDSLEEDGGYRVIGELGKSVGKTQNWSF